MGGARIPWGKPCGVSNPVGGVFTLQEICFEAAKRIRREKPALENNNKYELGRLIFDELNNELQQLFHGKGRVAAGLLIGDRIRKCLDTHPALEAAAPTAAPTAAPAAAPAAAESPTTVAPSAEPEAPPSEGLEMFGDYFEKVQLLERTTTQEGASALASLQTEKADVAAALLLQRPTPDYIKRISGSEVCYGRVAVKVGDGAPSWRDGPVIFVGRDASMDIVVDDPRVSRVHAMIVVTTPFIFVLDNWSAWGTSVGDDWSVRGARRPFAFPANQDATFRVAGAFEITISAPSL